MPWGEIEANKDKNCVCVCVNERLNNSPEVMTFWLLHISFGDFCKYSFLRLNIIYWDFRFTLFNFRSMRPAHQFLVLKFVSSNPRILLWLLSFLIHFDTDLNKILSVKHLIQFVEMVQSKSPLKTESKTSHLYLNFSEGIFVI